MKHRVVCEAVKKGEVNRRGISTDDKAYCYGYTDARNDEPIETCKNCIDWVCYEDYIGGEQE